MTIALKEVPVSRASQKSQTTTQAQGIDITPRLPEIDFDESLPRMHGASLGVTALLNLTSVFANVAEKMFIQSARKIVPFVESDNYREELMNFITQEAYHSRVHERMNKVQKQKGYPIDDIRGYLQSIVDDVFDIGGHRMVIAAAVAGEQMIGVFGDCLLENPEVLDGCDDKIREMLFWHAYEEVEHSAALFDSYNRVIPDAKDAYRLRKWGALYTYTLLIVTWMTSLHMLMEFEGKGEGKKMRNWKSVKDFLFGDKGVFRDSGDVMSSYWKKDFHPWENRDACKILADRKEYVRDEWIKEIPASRKDTDFGDRDSSIADITKATNNLTEAFRYTRFLLRTVTKSYKFSKTARKNDYWRSKNSYLDKMQSVSM